MYVKIENLDFMLNGDNVNIVEIIHNRIMLMCYDSKVIIGKKIFVHSDLFMKFKYSSSSFKVGI